MMVEDLGVEAKEAAVREVAKLLPLPELLQSIASIKADYIARQQVYKKKFQQKKGKNGEIQSILPSCL